MVSNPLSLTRKASLLYRFVRISGKPTLHFGPKHRVPFNPIHVTGLRGCSTTFCYSKSLNSSNGFVVGAYKMGFDRFRVMSVSRGGSGGLGGGNSGGGGGGGGGAEPGGGGSEWSLLSWYLGLLANYSVLTKAVTSAVLTLGGDLVCQLVIEEVPSLDLKRAILFTFLGMALVGPILHFWLTEVFLAFDVFFIICCIGMACVIFLAIFCCIPVLAIAYAVAVRKGASEDDIRRLPKYRYCQYGPLRALGNNGKEQGVFGNSVGSSNSSSTSGCVLLPEDSECCICLCRYVDGAELYSLPCNHHFHCVCISKWLRINATCPLCKFDILSGDTLV